MTLLFIHTLHDCMSYWTKMATYSNHRKFHENSIILAFCNVKDI